MRQIKFRGKSLNDKKWMYGFYCRHDYGAQYQDKKLIKAACSVHDIWTDNGWVAVEETSIGQFTGLTDSAGKEIYEWDILGTPDRVVGYVKGGVRGYCYDVVYINHPSGEKDWSLYATVEFDYPNIEVIGNVFDNPELIPNQPTAI